MRKADFYICKNNDADQLCSNCTFNKSHSHQFNDMQCFYFSKKKKKKKKKKVYKNKICTEVTFEPSHEKTNKSRSDTKKMARSIKFLVEKEEALNYLWSENKGADQLIQLCICCCICILLVFRYGG